MSVPVEHQSKAAVRLRDLARRAFKSDSKEQRLLLEAAAEIEGGEQAFADLVEANRILREKVARFERNLA